MSDWQSKFDSNGPQWRTRSDMLAEREMEKWIEDSRQSRSSNLSEVEINSQIAQLNELVVELKKEESLLMKKVNANASGEMLVDATNALGQLQEIYRMAVHELGELKSLQEAKRI
jgi:hypothetical protein